MRIGDDKLTVGRNGSHNMIALTHDIAFWSFIHSVSPNALKLSTAPLTCKARRISQRILGSRR